MAIGYVDDSKLTAVADAIRAKKGTTDLMTLDQMPTEIEGIAGGGSTEEKNANVDFSKLESLDNSSSPLPYYIDYLDVGNFVPSGTSLDALFYGLGFYSGVTLKNIENWDTSKVTSMDSTFCSCNTKNRIDISGWDTSNVTNMNNLFDNNANIPNIAGGNFSIQNVTTMKGMFAKTDIETFSFDIFAIYSKVTALDSMFQGCSKLTKVDLTGFKTPSLSSVYNLFAGCTALTTVIMPDIVTYNVKTSSGMFTNCTSLVNVTWGSNWLHYALAKSFNLSDCEALSHDSILDLFNKLATRTNSPTLTLHADAKARMSEEEIKIATDKGWTVA